MKRCMLLVIALAACGEAHKVPVSIGGSRSDAIVEMGYETTIFETAVVDWNAAQRSATKSCQAWGFTGAEAFEGSRSECTFYAENGMCLASNVIRTYQCTR